MGFLHELFDVVTGKRVIENISLDDTILEAAYYPTSGRVSFKVAKDSPEYGSVYNPYTALTGKGAFRTMNLIIPWLEKHDAKKVSFYTEAPSKDQARVRDKLYTRSLRQAGYTCLNPGENDFINRGIACEGPLRRFKKINKK